MSPITTAAEAEQAHRRSGRADREAHGLVEQETALVHAGQVRNATALDRAKSGLAGRALRRRRAAQGQREIPAADRAGSGAALRRVQEAFAPRCRRNMIVLATAHAVSEGIMRRLSGDLARKAAPQVYGASGRTAPPNPKHGRPLAVSRVL